MESTRQQKFSRLIQKELAYIFQREFTHLLPNKLISINTVRMSPDLGFAKVFVSAIGGGEEIVDVLRPEVKTIRHSLAKRIRNQVRVVPEIAFFYDDTISYANRIDDILSGLDIPEETPDEEDDNYKD